MKKINKILSFSIVSICAACAGFSVTKALSIIGASDGQLNIKLAEETKYNLTYHLPTTNGAFSSTTISVKSGTNIYEALQPYTGNINGFSFNQWNYSTQFRDDMPEYYPVSTTSALAEDTEVYAKYIKNNMLYYYHTSDRVDYYLDQSYTDYGLNASSVYYGTQIYSLSGVQGIGVELTSSTGIYKFTRNNYDWTIERKITFSIDNVSSWWFDAGAVTYIACMTSDDSETYWIEKKITSSVHNYTTYLNPKFTKFIILRKNPANDGPNWDGIWNQTVDALVANGYSSGTTKLSVNNYPDQGNKQVSWIA